MENKFRNYWTRKNHIKLERCYYQIIQVNISVVKVKRTFRILTLSRKKKEMQIRIFNVV